MTDDENPYIPKSQVVRDNIAAEASTQSSATILEGPGTSIGRYKLLQLIGEGGFGSVFMAEQQVPVRRRVALKIIKLGMDTRQVIARFEAERQALAIMDHPNIARVLDGGATESGRPYFVMELVNGDPITRYCDANQLDIRERLDLFIQVCRAVQHAHQKGIIHRDLKPSNVLVSTQDGKASAKVIDFGIAKATVSRLTEKTLFTEHRALIGTPEYMSPEQAGGSLDIDTRSDVYSLGVLLYELLTGSTPFAAFDLRVAAYHEIERVIREIDPPKPSTRLSASVQAIRAVAAHRRTEPKKLGMMLRGELDWIVMKALDKSRARRYESAGRLGDDVASYCAGGPVVAAQPTAAYRLRKFARRYRAAIATTATVVSLLAAGVVASSIEALRAHRAERQVASQLIEVRHAREVAQQQTNEARSRLNDVKQANQRVEAALQAIKRGNSDRFVNAGIKEWDNKQFAYAALWFIEALKLDQGDPEREHLQKMRVWSSLRQCPRPVAIRVSRPASGYEIWVDGKEFGVANATTHKRTNLAIPRDDFRNLDLSPSGKTIIGRSFGAFMLWDARTGAPLTSKITGQDRWPTTSGDLAHIALPTLTGVQIVDTESAKVTALPPLPDGKDNSISFSPDGSVLAMSWDKHLRLWNVQTGAAIGAEMPHVNWFDFSKDGLIFFKVSTDGIMEMLDGRTGQARWTFKYTDAFPVISPDGHAIVNLSNGLVEVYDTLSGKRRFGQPAFENARLHASFSDDRKVIVVIAEDGRARVIDAITGSSRSPVVLRDLGVFSFNFKPSPNGSQLLGWSQNSGRLWDLETGLVTTNRVPSSPDMKFSADSNELITTYRPADDGASDPGVYETHFGLSPTEVDADLYASENFEKIAFCDGGKHILVVAGGCARLLDASTGSPSAPPLCTDSSKAIFNINADRTRIVVGVGKTVHMFDATSGLEMGLPLNLPEPVTGLALSSEGRFLAVSVQDAGEPNATTRVWDLQDRNKAFPQLKADLNDTGLFSPDGRMLLSLDASRSLIAWDVNTAREVPVSNDDSQVAVTHFTVGKTLSGILWNGQEIRLLDTLTGRREGNHELFGYPYSYVSRDGTRLLNSVSANGAYYVLEAGTRKEICRTPGQIGTLTNAAFSHDGRLIAISDILGRVWVVDGSTGIPVVPALEYNRPGVQVSFDDPGRQVTAVWDDGHVAICPLAFNDVPLDTTQALAEFLAAAHIDDTGQLVEAGYPNAAQQLEHWNDLRKKLPDFFTAVEDPPENLILPEYRNAVQAKVRSATTASEKQQLARTLAQLSHHENAAAFFAQSAVLAETALTLDGSLLDAKDDLANDYVNLGRPGDALPIYAENAGRRFRYWDNPDAKPDWLFGANILDTLDFLRSYGKDVPTFAKIEAIIRPTTRPATEPTTQPATRPLAATD